MINLALFQSIELGSREFDTIITNPNQLRNIVEGFAGEYADHGPDRRAETRMRMALPTLLEPYDRNWKSLGYIVRAITRDFSIEGIGCIARDPVCGEYLSIRLELPDQNTIGMIAKMTRCDAIGDYHDIGCRVLYQAELIKLSQQS